MELSQSEFEYYGRQMIVNEIGKQGQLALKNARVFIIGAGGLGCPAITYLAGAGVGHLGVIDPDIVQASNLHRQFIHSMDNIGVPKVESAKGFVQQRNPHCTVDTHFMALEPQNALEIAQTYSLILDCTDTVQSRYLANDLAVLLGVPLVSASALRSEGQIAIYNYENGPCYRCMFPVPPPPNAVNDCSEGGIVGPVVGIMGVYMAILAIKIITKQAIGPPALTMFSMFDFPPWRTVKIRSRQKSCAVCGETPLISRTSFSSQNYKTFCGKRTLHKVENSSHIEPGDVDLDKCMVIDVRPRVQFEMCNLNNSINLPIDRIRKVRSLDELGIETPERPVVVVCRFGNDSQEAVNLFNKLGYKSKNLKGGLNKWSDLHPSFPRY